MINKTDTLNHRALYISVGDALTLGMKTFDVGPIVDECADQLRPE
jgi:hypothetical protein